MPQPDHAGRSGYLGWRIAAAIVSLLVYPPSLRADPVSSHELLQLDAGTYNGNFVNDDREQFFVGSGRGFEFNLFAFPGETGGTLLRDVGAVPFAVDPSLVVDLPIFGTVRLGTQEITSTFSSPFRLVAQFNARSQAVPSNPDGCCAFVDFPFFATGSLSGQSQDGGAFRFDFAGSGHGQEAFFTSGGSAVLSHSEVFRFEPTAATPEPATMMLLAGGVSLVLKRRRRLALGKGLASAVSSDSLNV